MGWLHKSDNNGIHTYIRTYVVRWLISCCTGWILCFSTLCWKRGPSAVSPDSRLGPRQHPGCVGGAEWRGECVAPAELQSCWIVIQILSPVRNSWQFTVHHIQPRVQSVKGSVSSVCATSEHFWGGVFCFKCMTPISMYTCCVCVCDSQCPVWKVHTRHRKQLLSPLYIFPLINNSQSSPCCVGWHSQDTCHPLPETGLRRLPLRSR